ncbi:MAG: hypothetical protein PHW87_07705, partial [Methanothrix sp.]|nr:hypothetical protein [Methanothrix sp.]
SGVTTALSDSSKAALGFGQAAKMSQKEIAALGWSEDQTTGKTKGLAGVVSSLTENSKKAGDTVGNFFSKLDMGRLVVAGAAAGMVNYAKSALQVAESHRLNIDMIKDQLGAQSQAALSFIQAGDKGFGTSSLTRGNLAGYMAMTGYKDEKQIEKNIKNAEKIMSSKWGQSLAGFGISDEKGLLDTLSNPIQETSNIGRVLKDKMPEFFRAGTLQTLKQEVSREQKFAFQSDEVVEAEARRRLASKAMEKIAGQVEPDKDSYRVGLRNFTNSFAELNEGVGNAVRPAAGAILMLMSAITRLLSAAPEIPVLIAVVLGLGTAFATLGAVLPLVSVGIKALTTSLMANPFALAITAIIALVVIFSALEARFGIFSKAWDHFSKSAIGKDLIDGVKSLFDSISKLGGGGDIFGGLGKGIEFFTSKIAGIFDQIDGIYKMVKGGDIGGALKGGLGLALKVTPIGMAASFAEALLPSKRVQDMILFVLQKMKDLWDGFTRWLNDIWAVVAKFLDPLLKIFAYLKEIKEKIFGKTLTGDELKKAFIEAMKSNITTSRITNAPEQAIDLLYKMASGEVSGKDQVEAEKKLKEETNWNWSDIEISEAKEQYDKLKSGTGASSGMVNTVNNFVERVKNPVKTIKESGGLFDNSKAPKDESFWDATFREYSTLKDKAGAAFDYFTKNDIGGEVTKSGLGWIDEGEPIVPAEVARSSVLIDSLRGIASGQGAGVGAERGSTTIKFGDINIINPQGDAQSIAQQVKAELEKQLDDFSFKAKVEAIIQRADRTFIA